MAEGRAGQNMDQEWENRVLCNDESCIGTIGADGRCRECGLTYKGELPAGFDPNEDTASSPETEADQTEDGTETATDETSEADPDLDDEWQRRTLCRDESCIGVIDEKTGRCKECGNPLHET